MSLNIYLYTLWALKYTEYIIITLIVIIETFLSLDKYLCV